MKNGTEVICVDDKFVDDPKNPFRPYEIKKPEKGKKYTIRKVVETKYGDGILLNEIKNRTFFFDDISSHQEPIFNIKRFETVK